MKSKIITSILLLLVILISSCKGKADKNEERNSLVHQTEEYDSIVWKNNSEKKEIYKYLFKEGQLKSIEVLTSDSVLVHLQSYDSLEQRDSSISFYSSGKIKSIDRFYHPDNGVDYINERISYSQDEQLNIDESFFYELRVQSKEFETFDTSYLTVKYRGSRMQNNTPIVRVIVPSFFDHETDNINPDGARKAAIFHGNEFNEFKIPIYTGKPGKYTLEFILEEYEEVDYSSEPLPMFGSFDYEVK